MSIVSRSPRRDRKVRAGMVLVLVLAGTALIGWGGLAAWQAVTQNNGSTAITDGVHMQNVATPTGGTSTTCTDQTSPSGCGVIFTVSNITPGYGPAAVGTVAITNTGSEQATFDVSLKSAAVTGADSFWNASTDTTLCSDLQLTVTDSETSPVTVYTGSLSAMSATGIAVKDSGGSAIWPSGATNTFTFTLSLPTSSPNTDEDSTCTADYTWGESGA